MYANATSKISTKCIESDWFEIQSCAGQGDVLSPLLFIIFMDKCLRDIGPGMYRKETMM